ncbi:zinc finger protein 62-like [Phymastichus coffea]|uniref:zinc finger protein 62-like n=1 Tax=Phymastichus coffea TaxID=108790 RepID=UPI00273B1C6D|nr:zinc finger protein 62-like [Phymastichus coffea]
MDDVVEISLANACRLCLTTDQTRSSIFTVPYLSVPIVDKIRSCLSIQVLTTDKVSTQICTSCINSVNRWHTYKISCLRTQKKLKQWLATKTAPIPTIIKEEPMDMGFTDNNAQAINELNNTIQVISNGKSIHSENNIGSVVKPTERKDGEISPGIHIKPEPLDTEDEDDFSLDVESTNSGELLINPMAVVVGNTANNDRIMEADSTQKFAAQKLRRKKKFRRGPHTHFRGARLFKKKCPDCQIYLHSKFSYTQHMSRYHGIPSKTSEIPIQPSVNRQKSKLTDHVDDAEPISETEIELSPEEIQFEKMIKTDPLTPVQKNIIGQLKTFSCFTCKQTFFDRRHTLNHIRQHMPDLRPYTCIACLTEFSDRSMYKLHCGASFECAMKIALVVPKVGSEKYFTCNMCLKPFSNRSELLNHLAEHAEKQHKQLNEPLRPLPQLKPMTSTAQVPKQIECSPSSKKSTAGPYMNGDPAHNHMCNLCGMIYRYKPNMFKHRDLCATLPANIRTSYRCFHCDMTYLVYKKFYTHIFSEHKKREITCYSCQMKFFTADEYLTHHETHRDVPIEDSQMEIEQQPESSYPTDADPMNSSTHPTDVGEKAFNCALCGENFATKAELSEHRNLHLKVKIYSCVICRSMFSSSGALEVHMKDHGIQDAGEQNANSSCVEYNSENSLNQSTMSAVSDPGGKFNHCYECNKNFSNYANLKRHERNLHGGKQRRRWSCDECKRRFKSIDDYNQHVATAHRSRQAQSPTQSHVQPQLQPQPEKLLSTSPPKISATTGKPLMQCPKCPKMFAYQGNLIQHCQNVHKENHFERIIASSRAVPLATPSPPRPVQRPPTLTSRGHTCDVCGKTFREEQSLKVHRGWHLRTNYRLKKDQNASLDENMLSGPGYTITPMSASPPKPAKARKSFPNNPSQKQLNAVTSLQCQVCADRFSDVAELRKHLWDVHCARNKTEKSFTSDLQCELCTNKFPDEEALKNHMKWHQQNPILAGYHNGNDLNRIETVDETNKPFYCETCGKYYSNRKVFLRHKKLHKVLPVASMMNLQSLQSRRNCYCNTCQKNFATEASLRRHKASQSHLNVVRSQIPAKKITTTALIHHPPPDPLKYEEVKNEPNAEFSAASPSNLLSRKKSVTCSDCMQMFPNMSVLYQHKQLVHKIPTATKVMKPTSSKPTECVPLMNSEGFVCCNVCGKQFPGLSNLKQHFSHKHKPRPPTFPCIAPGCKLIFHSLSSLKNHETTHTNMIYNCNLCDKHVFSKTAINKHMIVMHKAIYQSGASKSALWSELDLTNYTIKNCQGMACPKCNVKYPNLRALKIHHYKFHEKT